MQGNFANIVNMINQLNQQAVQKYLYDRNTGRAFPSAIQNLPEEERQRAYASLFSNSLMGATTAPGSGAMILTPGEETFVRNMSRKIALNRPTNLQQQGIAESLYDVNVPIGKGGKEVVSRKTMANLIDQLRALTRSLPIEDIRKINLKLK